MVVAGVVGRIIGFYGIEYILHGVRTCGRKLMCCRMAGSVNHFRCEYENYGKEN